MTTPIVSVIIPAYNEENTITQVLERVASALAGSIAYEIIAVNDGSTDRTSALLQHAPQHVRVLHNKRNIGKTPSIARALEQARGSIAIVQDADLEYDPRDILPVIEPILRRTTNIAYGSRYLKTPKQCYQHVLFYLGGRIATMLANLLYGYRLTDEPTCYKAFRTSLLERMQITGKGFEFCHEFTAKAGKLKERIIEVPISYAPRSKTDGKKLRMSDGFAAYWTLIKLRFS